MNLRIKRGHGTPLALVGALVAAGAVQLAVAPTATAASATISRVKYTCTAEDPTISLSLGGPRTFYVTATTDLPAKVNAGDSIPPTKTDLTLILPTDLVNRMYDKMKVRKVKGTSTSDVVLQAVAPGGSVIQTLTPPVTGLKVENWVPLVPDTEVAIAANGSVAAQSVPSDATNGLIYVEMPLKFVLDSEMDPPVVGAIDKARLNCERPKDPSGATRVIGTIAIGDGCSTSDCPVPAEVGSSTTTPTTPPTSGAGDGTDPAVIDPVVPDGETPIDNGVDYGVDSNSASGPGTTTTVTATTELPATGSPVGLWLLTLVGTLAAARVALVVRARRRAS